MNWTIEGLGEAVADPGRWAGGGAVAAMSLVGATATAELVLRLSHRRRDLSDDQKQILGALLEEISTSRSIFLTAIDEDMSSLEQLMSAQRALRRARKQGAVEENDEAAVESKRAVQEAIESPLRTARRAAGLLEAIDQATAYARPFTLSDLGAAAATTRGAITSLLLMAEVNLDLLENVENATRYRAEIQKIGADAEWRAARIVETTRDAIHGTGSQDQG